MEVRLRALLVLGLLLTTAAWGGAPDLFVNNRPFVGRVELAGGELHVSLKELLEALRLGWELQDGKLLIVEDEKAKKPVLDGVRALYFQRHRLSLRTHQVEGQLLVPLRDFSAQIGAGLEENRELGTIDVFSPVSFDRVDERARVTDGKSAGSPLKLEELSYRVRQAPPEEGNFWIHSYIVLHNREQRTLNRVVLRLRWLDPEGREVGKMAYPLKDIGPGVRATFQLPVYALNQDIQVRPEVKLSYLP